MKLYSLFLVLSSNILFIACSKTDTPDLVKTPVTLLSKAYSYYSDTTSAPYYVDLLEYNDKNQVNKINVYRNLSDTLVYAFSYNTNGDIAQMHVRSAKNTYENNDYYLSYNAAKKVDSIRQVNAHESFLSLFKYNSQNVLSEVLTYLTSAGDATLTYHSTYFRSTQLDSINSDNFGSNERVNRRMASDIIEAKPVLAINKAYVLMMAQRLTFRSLFSADIYDPGFSHQFANPDELIIRNGSTMSYPFANRPVNLFPYSNTFSLNTEGAVRLYKYSYSQGIFSQNINIYYKFEYITK